MSFKPYQLAHLEVEVSTRRRLVEVISRPTPDNTIMVRMVPGEPTTMLEVKLGELHSRAQNRYLHIARVTTGFVFPEDMLRYDNAALYDHTLPEDGGDDRGLPVPPEGLLVYTDSANRKNPWTLDRWNSFSCTVTPVLIRDLRNHTDLNTVPVKY